MSPFLARCTWSEATWEITESEHIDFPRNNLGGGPDEELQRRCSSRILLPPTGSPAARGSPGWGRRAAPPDLARGTAGLPVGTAGQCPLPKPGSVPEPRRSLRPHVQDMQGSPAASGSKGHLARGKPQIWGILAPGSPQLKPRIKSHGSLSLGARGTVRASHAGLQGDLEETGGKPVPVVFASVSLPLEASVSR